MLLVPKLAIPDAALSYYCTVSVGRLTKFDDQNGLASFFEASDLCLTLTMVWLEDFPPARWKTLLSITVACDHNRNCG